MPIKPGSPSIDPVRRFDAALDRPHTWVITGIDAFWLERADGSRLTGEFPGVAPAYAAVLVQIGLGVDLDDIVLVGRRRGGSRSVLGHGRDLLDVAEAHAGVPAARRRRE